MKWILGITGSILTAAIIACCSFMFHANAEMAVVKATTELHNTNFINHEHANEATFNKVETKLDKIDEKIDKLMDKIDRANRRNERPQ